MGRPAADLDDYLDWQERLESYKASGLNVDVFCLREGVSRSTSNDCEAIDLFSSKSLEPLDDISEFEGEPF